jgi:hypothetical protein
MQLATKSVKAILGATTISSLSLADPTFAAAQTFLGSPANNALGGQVQVQITVDGGKITAITTPVTLSGRNASYANYAIPTLTSRALAAQSANIQGVSGASYVSAAWKQSLASAIANAGSALGTVVATPSATPTTTRSATPLISVIPAPKFGAGNEGGEHQGFGSGESGESREGGEGGDDGYRTPRPSRPPRPSRAPLPTASAKPTPSPSATTVPSAPTLGLTPGAGVIKKTITCVKGTATKTVKALNPKCPTGYTLKKK